MPGVAPLPGTVTASEAPPVSSQHRCAVAGPRNRPSHGSPLLTEALGVAWCPAPRGWPLRPAHGAPANPQRFAVLCPQRIEHGPAGPPLPPQALASMHWRFLPYALRVHPGRFPEGFRFHRAPSRTLLLPPGHFRFLKPRDQ